MSTTRPERPSSASRWTVLVAVLRTQGFGSLTALCVDNHEKAQITMKSDKISVKTADDSWKYQYSKEMKILLHPEDPALFKLHIKVSAVSAMFSIPHLSVPTTG